METIVTSKDISLTLQTLGIEPGDTVLVHSSMKSMGCVDGGAEAVIRGFEDVLGKEGTLVMPTLCQVDFTNSYKTWYMDKPSDVGYLTEFFRKQVYVYRSSHPTHSVAARGKNAYELSHEHTAYGAHVCPFGEYAFADSSPWLKMYRTGAKIVFLGVSMRFNTMKHAVEARFVESLLGQVPDEERRKALQMRLRSFGSFDAGGIWPFYNSLQMQEELEKQGLVRHAGCGDADVLCVPMKESSDAAFELLKSHPEQWCDDETMEWIRACTQP